MKRLLSIFFLMIFLFNVGGYYLVFWALQYRANQTAQNRVETGHYPASDEIRLSIPLSLPYPIYEEGFTRVYGTFEYEGMHYKLVKQKIQNDMLIVVGIKDEQSTKLENTLSTVAKAAHSQKSSKEVLSLAAKLFEYFQNEDLLLLGNLAGWSRDIVNGELNLSCSTASQPIDIPPPRYS